MGTGRYNRHLTGQSRFWYKRLPNLRNPTKTLAEQALHTATRLGAQYADARLVESREQDLSVNNGRMDALVDTTTAGIGLRVLVRGAWGFAATDQLSGPGVERLARQAVAIARASAVLQRAGVTLSPTKPAVANWTSPYQRDPFQVPLDTKLQLLFAVDERLRRVKGITLSRVSIGFVKTIKHFVSTEGASIRQTFIQSGGGYTAYASKDGVLQRRSYPTSFGGQHLLAGYELLEQLDLVTHAERVAEEAVALHKAAPCPNRTTTLILDSSQVALQIHESIGHAIEGDRVLGHEANYAGTSFLSASDLGRLRYGSPHVTIVADARPEHGPGLGTARYDDEGVPARRVEVIRDGLFVGFLTSRETARALGQTRSSGAMRAQDWNRLPIIRMTNISLLPGHATLEDLIADTADGIFMETNRSWSIDDRRLQFQFGTEIAWEIKRGKRRRMLKHPTYAGITTGFWRSCEAVGRDWVLWGIPTCGKGQPSQTIGVGHGAASALFRQVEVGVTHAARR